MIPVSTLNDEYIHRPKLTEQKNPFEYIVPPPPPPLKRGRNNECVVNIICLKIFLIKHISLLYLKEPKVQFSSNTKC